MGEPFMDNSAFHMKSVCPEFLRNFTVSSIINKKLLCTPVLSVNLTEVEGAHAGGVVHILELGELGA